MVFARQLLLWPIVVKTKKRAHKYTTIVDSNQIDHDSCVSYVQRVLKKHENLIVEYENQLKETKQRLNNRLTTEIEEAVVKFVRQNGIGLARLIIERQIASIEYTYQDRLLELEFEQQNPNEYQKNVFEKLYQAKSEKELSKLDVAVLKQRVVHNFLPESFHSLEIPAPISLDTIVDTNTRQRLTQECEKILQRTKSDMMLVYITVAEETAKECHRKFDSVLTQMKENQHSIESSQTLTQTMLDIIERRFHCLNQHFIYLYKLKIRFFVKAPTVEN